MGVPRVACGDNSGLADTDFFFFNDTATTEIYTLSLHDALPILFSSAGHRVTSQTSFKSGSDDTTRNLYRRMAKGNTLFRNLGDDTFEEITDAGVEMGRWSWSSLFADLNNDGREDLLVANGYITTEDTGDL